MTYGNWELRDDSYYFHSSDAQIFPSSNAIDQGKLTTEENVRNIYRDLTDKNFVTKYNYFSMKVNVTRNAIIVSPGECVINGYHFYAKNTIEVFVPNDIILGEPEKGSPPTQYTLGISLSYDAANHVTGDIINKELDIGSSEILSGVYLKWFDECQLECNYDNILILGRAWVKNGKIVPDGYVYEDRIIYHGFEQDPFKDHKYQANTVEVQVYGHTTTNYDTLRDNMTDIHNGIYSYDSMHYPIELNRLNRTKPPTHNTDVQDYIDHIPDWYSCKYGDYFTGALRFNHLSIDAIREFKSEDITKDGISSNCADGLYLTPRTYGDFTRDKNDSVQITTNKNNKSFDYDIGGTVLSIVPTSYNQSRTTDYNNGYYGIHAALLSQKYGETGIRIHNQEENSQSVNGTTRLVHYNKNDDGQFYRRNDTNSDHLNTSNFIIENIDKDARISSIDMKHGEVFFDSFTTTNASYSSNVIGLKPLNASNQKFTGNYKGSGFQFFVSAVNTSTINNIDFRIDEHNISMAQHQYTNHRSATRGTQHNGTNTDNLHIEMGLGISYDSNVSYNNIKELNTYGVSYNNTNNDSYLCLGNFRLRSNIVTGANVRQNTLEVLNTDINSTNVLPYLRIRPRTYSEQFLAEEVIQVGTTKYDDYFNNNAQQNTLNKILLKRVNTNSNDSSTGFTYYEQTFKASNESSRAQVLVKMRPPINNTNLTTASSAINYNEIAGIFSHGNVGCSTYELTKGSITNTEENSDDKNKPYTNNNEWVRFTRFRYDNDKDQINSGTYTGVHDNANGRKWGDTYNLEFNTTVSNRRANQIIWRYKGSSGSQTSNLNNTPPVVLSYIHDTTEETNTQGIPTKYTNWNSSENPGYNGGKGTYETYIDHNGITHHNPTNKVRDILLLENAGLVVSGDINNPSIIGDSLNTNNHFGVTITAGRVYNAVYNDIAETYEKDNYFDEYEPGMIISVNPETGKYHISDKFEDKLVVGVTSNTYAFLAGGNRIDSTKDLTTLENEYYTVAISGKVWANVPNNVIINPGDLLCSYGNGMATKSTNYSIGTIIGKALSKVKYFEECGRYKVLMQVMLG